MFTTLMDVLNSDELLEPLPEAAELPAAPAEPAPETGTSTQTETAPSSTNSATSRPQSTTSPTEAAPSSPASATSTTMLSPSTATASTTAGTTASTATTLSAGIGDDPIAVGAAYARLNEVDGRPQLVITTRGGTEVCTVALPGATGIVSAAGELTVTIDGRTRDVDVSSCEIA